MAGDVWARWRRCACLRKQHGQQRKGTRCWRARARMASVRPPHTCRPNNTILLLSCSCESSDDEEKKAVTSWTANVMRKATLSPCSRAEAWAACSEGACTSIMCTLRSGTARTRLIARSPRPPPMSIATHPCPVSFPRPASPCSPESPVKHQGETSGCGGWWRPRRSRV